MSAGIKLIVGLGNPGTEYEDTRHNAGEWFVREAAREARAQLRSANKYYGLHAFASLHGHMCHLLIPTTFMNQSGQAVHALAAYYKIPSQEILIVHDEIDLPPGIIRLKYEGGDGGHNGVKDIIGHLSTKAFYRLRIGVGRPQNSAEVIDYVLHPPSKTQRTEINTAMDAAQTILPLLLEGKIQAAMQKLHSGENHGS